MTKNIFFITTDQQHYSAVGYSNPEINTPNLDKLGREGIIFDRAYTCNPTCTPARASWITGLYPSQHGAYALGTKLPENVPTLGDAFRAAGYETALIGKAHFQPTASTEEYPSLEAYPCLHDLDFWRGFHGPFYGFDYVELARNHTDEAHVGQHYALWMEERGLTDWRRYFMPNKSRNRLPGDGLADSDYVPASPGEPWALPEEFHQNAWITERTIAKMEEYHQKAAPFFLWASYFDPHPAYKVPEPYASMYDPAKVTIPRAVPGEMDDKPPYFKLSREENPDFSDWEEPEGNNILGAVCHNRSEDLLRKNMAAMYGMVTMLDTCIGKLIDRLDELGLRESTMICFTTDHGDYLGHHGLTKKAIHHYEDLLRVPMIVSQPGTVPEGIRNDSLQSTVDLAPSFLSMTGLPVPREMTGRDCTPVWKGQKESVRDHVIVENRHQPTTMYMYTFIDERYKITIHYNREYGELYDLGDDPSELKNLWNDPESQTLKADLLLRFMYGEMGKAPLPMPRITVA